MKKLLLILMLVLSAVTITSRPVTTYAYTEEQKQQAKSWLSAHGYPPTRAGAEQAYQDYMDGKISVPEADAYLGRNQKKDIENKKNSTTESKQSTQKNSEQGKEDSTSSANKTTTVQSGEQNETTQAEEQNETTATSKEKVTTATSEEKKQKAEKKKQEQKTERKNHVTAAGIVGIALAIFGILVWLMRKRI